MGGVKLKNAGLVSALLSNTARATNEGTRAALRAGGDGIETLAKAYAPVDEHNLESAIGQEEDRGGLNGRMRIEIGIDESISVGKGKTVGDYAMVMHEALAPYGSGSYKLGKGSQAKRAGGNDVGGKFLERAAEQLGPEIKASIMAAIQKELRGKG